MSRAYKVAFLIVTLAAFLIAAVLVVLAVGLLPGSPVNHDSASSEERPNFVFIYTDDMRYDEMKRIPRFERFFIQKGTSFENAFITNPQCCPSRVTALTGKYSHNHGVGSNNDGYPGYKREVSPEDILPTWLKSEGYSTALFGKFLNRYRSQEPPEGFDFYYGGKGGDEDAGKGREAAEFVEANHEAGPMFLMMAVRSPKSWDEIPAKYESTHTDAVFEFPPSFNEEDLSDKPAWLRDRKPLSEEEQEWIKTHRRERLQTLEGVADAIGKVRRALEQNDELSNTYFIFMSDNGQQFGEHRLLKKGVPYEESIKTPFAVRGPGVPKGIVREEMATNNDLAPTMAELAGVETPPDLDGRSLMPLFSRDEVRGWRNAVLTENPGNRRKPAFAVVRTADGYSYIEWETGEKELYDLEEDPYQLDGAYEDADPALLARLQDRLEALKDCSGEECRRAENGS